MRKKPLFSQNVNNLWNCIFTRSDRETNAKYNNAYIGDQRI